MAVLNYRYRLLPTPEQEILLGRTMFFLWRGWARLVRFTGQAAARLRKGHAATLRAELAKWELSKALTGKRAAKFNQLVTEGLSHVAAMRQLNRDGVIKIWTKYQRGKLSTEYAISKAERGKRGMVKEAWGGCWAIQNRKYRDAWEACWKGLRERPRKGLPRNATWMEAQILNGQAPLLRKQAQGAFRENWADLKQFFPPRLQTVPDRIQKNISITLTDLKGSRRTAEIERLKEEFRQLTRVRLIQHRPLPSTGKVKDVKIIRSTVRKDAIWHIVFAVELPDADTKKEYPSTGLACGIDSGRKTTLVGQDAEIKGESGEELSAGGPYRRMLKKIRRLERKLNRQRRANNPHCFDEQGRWIRGQRITTTTKNMSETAAKLAEVQARAAHYRKDYYSKLTDRILNKYDAVFVGKWTDGTKANNAAKKARKETFLEDGTKPSKVEAARQRTANRNDRDNALGIFRQILKEKAKRSTVPKIIYEVTERDTIRTCVHCGALTGPMRPKGLSGEKWKCSQCDQSQLRDRGAAWNILQVGLAEQAKRAAASQTAGQAVTGGSQKPSVARTSPGNRRKGAIRASGTGTGSSNAPISRPLKGRVSEVAASGKSMANSREARPRRIHDVGVMQSSPRTDNGETHCATDPPAHSRGSPHELKRSENGSGRG